MRIRWKLLILLLVISLLPLGFLSWLEHRSLDRLGRDFGSHARKALIHRAGRQMLQLAQSNSTIIRREGEIIETILRAQAREAERCLVSDPPVSPHVLWAEDLDRGVKPPGGLTVSDRHYRTTADSRREPVPVTYEHQVLKLAPGVAPEDVRDDVARLSLMTPAYRNLGGTNPRLIHWQYTALACGVHSSYPAHGGYPEDFDPRKRGWYAKALDENGVTWNPPIVDASTGEVMLSVSMPVNGPGGTPAGVTGIDVKLRDILRSIKVPWAWSTGARILFVNPMDSPDGTTQLEVVAQQSYLEEDRSWKTPIELDFLTSDDETQLRELIDDMKARRGGVRKMPYQGNDSVWAYGPVDEQRTCLLLIVPYQDIIAQAVAAEAAVLKRTHQQVRAACIALIVVAGIVVLIAVLGSRTVTRPVAELADIAKRIAAGDLRARANIKSRDELGELGRTVNKMIPQLADRLRLRESLSLAMEVQQHLLPDDPPEIEGLDIAGRSIYCDETGGDYYDFLELTQLGAHCLGVAVGDVTGHGIAAALLMATGRALLRSRADQPERLTWMMNDMNRQLVPDTGGGRFMTLIYLLVDAKSRTLRWVCAGHDPPITYDPGSERFGDLRGGGIPLGIDSQWRYEEYTGRIPPDGQIIVIGTDGIWEARDPDDNMFGKDALRRIIRDNAQRSAEQISRAVTDTLTAFRQTRSQEDDVTLVVVKIDAEVAVEKACR